MLSTVFRYFLRGLLFVFPLGATLYIILVAVNWSNDVFNSLLYRWLNIDIPGLGIVTVFIAVTLIGYLFSTAFIRPAINFFERILVRVPIINIIYSSIKELTEAFVGEKKKFNKPVVVAFSGTNIRRLGFVTQSDLSDMGIDELVAVYCPHSYNFSGNLYLVPREDVRPLDLNSTDVMKYIVSAGVTKVPEWKS